MAAITVHGSVGIFAQQSLNMTLLSNWDDNTIPTVSGNSYNDVWGYAADGREYAIIGTSQGTQIIDVTVPTNPVLVSFQAGGSTASVWRDYKTYGTFLYAVSDQGASSSLQVFDLSSLPSTVTKVYDSQAIFSRAHNIFIEETSGRMYVLGPDNMPTGMHIVDIQTDPANPTLIVTLNAGAYVHDAYVRHDTVFAFMGNQGFAIFDFSNLASPSVINIIPFNAYPENGYSHSGWATDDFNYLYFCDETHDKGVHIGDFSNMAAPIFHPTFRSTLLAPTHTNSIPHNAFVKGNQLYISYYHDGVQIWDISNPINPVQSAYYDTEPNNTDYASITGAWGVYPYLPSGVILVSDIQHGLFVLQENNLFPVTLADFRVEDNEQHVDLRWKTYSETNNSHFSVERSADRVNFEPIDRVEGAGNNVGELNYASRDLRPLEGTSHYRLKQVDMDGTVSYSEVLTLNRGVDFSLMDVYPSPASNQDQVRIRLAVNSSQRVQLRVSNMVGQQVHLSDHELEPGIQTLELPNRDWSQGMYYVQVQGKGTLAEQKLMLGN